MMHKYSRYIGRVTRFPWAVLPEKFAIIAELVRERAAGYKPSDEEIAARIGGDGERRAALSGGTSIAVIPVHGVIAHRADTFEASSGGTSTELIGRVLQQAVADESVTAVLLDFDTPGGSVDGVPELAAQIAKATAVKPIIAHIDAMAASAGYWLASQCTEIVCTPSGMVGSIGVFLLLVDETKALEQAGVKVNAISAGVNKLEGAPWEPLSEESRAHFQGQVDLVYHDFCSAVANGLGVTLVDVKQGYGQGRVFSAQEALAKGMIHRIATVGDTLAQMVSGRVTGLNRMTLAATTSTVTDMTASVLTVTAQTVQADIDRDALDLASAADAS